METTEGWLEVGGVWATLLATVSCRNRVVFYDTLRFATITESGCASVTMATTQELAELLGVDSSTIQTWTSEFSDHLSPSQTAGPMCFGEGDLRVLAFVRDCQDAGDDNGDIHYGLNNDYHNSDHYIEFTRLHTPIFQDVPGEADETWNHGTIIGGMAFQGQAVIVARSYKLAADELLRIALQSPDPHEYGYPLFFLYRHAIELYLKSLLPKPKKTHELDKLIRAVEKKYGGTIGGWIRSRLWDFHIIDERSFQFRYADKSPSDAELWIDFHQLRTVMGNLVEAFEGQLRKNTKHGETI